MTPSIKLSLLKYGGHIAIFVMPEIWRVLPRAGNNFPRDNTVTNALIHARRYITFSPVSPVELPSIVHLCRALRSDKSCFSSVSRIPADRTAPVCCSQIAARRQFVTDFSSFAP